MANPTAQTPKVAAAPSKTVVKQVEPAPIPEQDRSALFEQPDPGVKIKKMAPEDSATHVTTLNDEEFRDALDLGAYAGEPAGAAEPEQEAEPLADVLETAREAAEGAAAGAEK